MRKKAVLIIVLAVIVVILPFFNKNVNVKADGFSDAVDEQLNNIDLSELQSFLDKIGNSDSQNIVDKLNNIVKGEYQLNFNSIFEYALNMFFGEIIELLPVFISVIAISIFCGLSQNFKGSFLSDSISDVIFFVCFLSISLLLSACILNLYENAKITIENISKLTQIMSPIILTLMVASGVTISASVYKPSVVFLSNGVTNIFLSIVLPLVAIMIAFSIVSNFSTTIKLSKYTDFATSIVKWIIGITATIFGVFISVQGITSACHDGISFKIAKYTISNSVPIVGGFVKDGFELVILTSVLLKNAIGVISVFVLFSIVLSPIAYMIVFSLLLKFSVSYMVQ
jgi:stage III sporulation protein AE